MATRKYSPDVLDDKAALRMFRRKLKWSEAHPVAELPRELLPDRPGIYVFQRSKAELNPADTLYVGKTDGIATSLRNRVWGYCVTPCPARDDHHGRQLIFQYRRAHRDLQIFVRWAVYTAAADIEGALIFLLTPPFNNRWETVWADEHDIEPRYVGEPYQGAPALRRKRRKK